MACILTHFQLASHNLSAITVLNSSSMQGLHPVLLLHCDSRDHSLYWWLTQWAAAKLMCRPSQEAGIRKTAVLTGSIGSLALAEGLLPGPHAPGLRCMQTPAALHLYQSPAEKPTAQHMRCQHSVSAQPGSACCWYHTRPQAISMC